MLRCGVDGVEAVAAETRHSFPRHTHEQFGIGVIDRGAQKSLSGRGLVEAGAGDVITVNPGEVHDGMPIGDSARAWRMLYFAPSLIADAVTDLSEGRTGEYEFACPVVGDTVIADRVSRLFAALTSDGGADAKIRGEELLLTLLASQVTERKKLRGSRSFPNSVFAARSLIDDDPAAPVTLADLAQASGLGRFQLLRGFAKATGLTPHAYLVQRRTDMARRLIAGGASLADAAAASGFADQSHMTRSFVRRYGVSPGVYADAVR